MTEPDSAIGQSPKAQLEYHLAQAHMGDSASMRRVAELMELLERPSEAQTWWRRAADAGDPEAQDIVSCGLDTLAAKLPDDDWLEQALQASGARFRTEASQIDYDGLVKRTLSRIHAEPESPAPDTNH